MAVHLSVRGHILRASIDHPPVNALSQAVRAGLEDALEKLEDEDLQGLVIESAQAPFSAGADIREFSSAPREPHLPALLERMAACPKPIAAAIRGLAFGGGLELALAADWRAAAPGTRFGLPEVNLGLIPGAGGTQRLPRLVGGDASLRLITSGKPIGSKEALQMGLIDVEDDDPVAMAFELLERGKRPASEGGSAPSQSVLEETRSVIAKRHRLEPARHAAIEMVLAASQKPLSEGLALERETFLALKETPEARALRYAFRAERDAAKLPARAADAETQELRSAVVVGAGAMGRNIAYAFAKASLDVTLTDRSADVVAKAEEGLRDLAAGDEAKGRISSKASVLEKLRYETEIPGGADLYLEAVFEDAEVKKGVMTAMADAGGPSAIIASNTSYLDLDDLARAVPEPERVVGLHFFNPAHVMRLLEVVEGASTAPATLKTAFALAKTLEKLPVRAGVAHGFIGNRIFQAYQREAGLMLLEGAEVETIDRAMRTFGMPLGIFETLDLAGLQVGTAMRRARDPEAFDIRAFAVHDALTAEDRTGRRAGEGFYVYSEARPVPSERPLEIASALAEQFGTAKRKVTGDEVAERCALAMAIEGFRAVEDGTADSEEAVDTVMLHGFGFPRTKGGPIFHARSLGLDHVTKRAAFYASATASRPEDWTLPNSLTENV
ncbi:MAG: 3-hydroxyacyl-CoA dehydrogenase NAD-binding domain-containing protein [Parvularcula sp.]|jgi:3-hydroxyacyl-CoA dehydrogenase|nr:3-hydroxyacyl-CoA dehydrogenase NAD-binding domain-containing protein [Parvularcula sp.]